MALPPRSGAFVSVGPTMLGGPTMVGGSTGIPRTSVGNRYLTSGPNAFNPSPMGGGLSLPTTEIDPIGDLYKIGIGALGNWIQGQLSGGGPTSGASPGEGSGGCQQGFQWNPATGRCEEVGVAGGVRRLLPGGQTGLQGQGYGNAVMGAFGIPALEPAVVGAVSGKDGTARPIHRCPPGAVLGKDDLCYMKGSIPRQFRKWKPAPKPVLSAADAKSIRRIGTLQNRVKKLAGDVGFSCRKR